MKLIKTHNEFIIDKLFELLVNNTGNLQLVFSAKFRYLIESIDHPIASRMIISTYSNQPFTLIDITDENDMISFTSSPKLIDYINNYYENEDKTKTIYDEDFYEIIRDDKNKLWDKYRSKMKIGKLVKKLYKDRFPDNGSYDSIETFVNLYKSNYTLMLNNTDNLFEIVSGKDIIKWYDQKHYALNGNKTVLNQSCMSYGCNDYLEFYAINSPKVRLLILFENENRERIVARALVWELSGQFNGRFFLDRIYYQKPHIIDLFIEYAKQNDWFWKKHQSTGENEISGKGLKDKYPRLEVIGIKPHTYFPYLDTLKYYNYTLNKLSNYKNGENGEDILLNDAGGGTSNAKWSDFYKRWISDIDTNFIYCSVGTRDWRNGDKYRLKDDCTYINKNDDFHGWIPNSELEEKTEKINGKIILKEKYR